MKKRLVAVLLAVGVLALTPVSDSNAASKDKAKINIKKVTLNAGQKKTLKLKKYKKLSKKAIKKVKWSTSNKKVVAIKSTKGKYKQQAVIIAKKPGKATIKLKYNGKTYKCSVNVKGNKKKEIGTTEKSTEEKTIESTTGVKTTESTSEEKSTEVTTGVESSTEETTEKTTEVEDNSIYYSKKEYSNNYEYVEYSEGDEFYSNTSKGEDYSVEVSTPSFSNLISPVGGCFDFSFDVRHSLEPGALNPYGYYNTRKYWVYKDDRTMRFLINTNNDEATENTENYISNIQITATDLVTGEITKEGIYADAIGYEVKLNERKLTFKEGYAYKVVLPSSMYVIRNYGSRKDTLVDTTYYFIVTDDLSKISKPEFPNNIKVDIKENKTNTDVSIPFTEYVNNGYNNIKHAKVYYMSEVEPRLTLTTVSNSINSDISWELPLYVFDSNVGWKLFSDDIVQSTLGTYGSKVVSNTKVIEQIKLEEYKALVIDDFGYIHNVEYGYLGQ